MAVRSMLGVRPRRTGEELAKAVSRAPKAGRRPRRRAFAPWAATNSRSAACPREVLGHVPRLAADDPRSDVQPRSAQDTRGRGRTAPGSDSGPQRGLARVAGVLPDADSGGVHRSSTLLRLHEANHPGPGIA